ncbi:MarR family transcriptional regulator [Novosphingobium guangzhouense]|uniref:Transcriptional regulator n=1 Tax=Novosphingobium guangzhouense TaxID=1850347 RepID=A0A2K2FU42_9SPHN|nr:MarR family transcriptional regulator [Novosphingobium guangzhouense]PNU02296.1 hypothetical protein A8V01_26750 [Novosphingobium guangzhouense]
MHRPEEGTGADAELLSDIASQALQLNSLLNTFLVATPDSLKGSKETVSAEDMLRTAKRIYDSRRLRENFFGAEILGEPGWDLILDLYISHAEDRQLSITAAAIGSCAPATTALRWITALEKAGLLLRSSDVKDQRRTFLHLSPKGVGAMEDLLRAMASI